MEPGARSPWHAHTEEFEEIYVLAGSFFDDAHQLVAGDYACRAAGVSHCAGTDQGAVVLLVYRRR
jgi:quercetin dioxygenase-like cupin family protein